MHAAEVTSTSVGLTRFTAAAQEEFAEVSGDFNPIHMDPVAARRTAAGQCVVHGVQSLLWALEQLSRNIHLERLCAVDADFAQFLYVGEDVTLAVVRDTTDEIRAELRAGSLRVSQIVVRLGLRATSDAANPLPGEGAIAYGPGERCALPLSWDDVASAAGTVSHFGAPARVRALYPNLARCLGEGRVRAFLSLTRLVGMVSPGLHSTFHRINVRAVDDAAPPDRLVFSTISNEPRFGLVTLSVRGTGIAGQIKASWREPPARQPPAASLRALVDRDKFRGQTALVIGGSRGLGEVTAKLLAMGGARTIVTYASGLADAEAVAADIRQADGTIDLLRFDALLPAAAQLVSLPVRPDSMYFFATPRISGRAAADFCPQLHTQFGRFYVDAFHDTCIALRGTRPAPLQVFYPSTAFVTQPEKSLAEYAMAKAAGEALAAYMTRFTPGVEVHTVRLPRLLTDQTASILGTSAKVAADTMWPVVEYVQGRVAAQPAAARRA